MVNLFSRLSTDVNLDKCTKQLLVHPMQTDIEKNEILLKWLSRYDSTEVSQAFISALADSQQEHIANLFNGQKGKIAQLIYL